MFKSNNAQTLVADFPTAEKLPADLDTAVKIAAELLWAGGIKAACSKESEDPYIETADLRLGEGRDGSGADYARQAIDTPWYDVADQTIESNIDYIANECDSAVDNLVDREIERHGSAAELWERLIEAAERDIDDFDEDVFRGAVKDELRDWAREEGLDGLFNLEAQLTGRCGAYAELAFDCPCWEQGPVKGPDFIECNKALDWAELLSCLNIHPADFANAARARTLRLLDDPESAAELGDDKEARAEARESAIAELERQGMSEPASRDPEKWIGGLRALADGYATRGWSLPPDGSLPAADLEALLDALTEAGDTPTLRLEFDATGEALQEHSELLDRFGENSPVCGENLARSTVKVEGAYATLEGVDLPLLGPLFLAASEIRFESQSVGDESLEACMASRREAARLVHDLEWALRRPQPEGPPRGPELTRRTLELCSKLAHADPEAARGALLRCVDREESWPEANELARRAIEETQALISARSSNRRSSATGFKQAAPAPTPAVPRLEDFDVRGGSLANAPWRHALTPELARSRDSLGNTLAHKACACQDPALLKFALHHAPESGSATNSAGIAPFDLIHETADGKTMKALALVLLAEHPELANLSAGAQSGHRRVLIERAAGRRMDPETMGELLDAGCVPSILSPNGAAFWDHYSHMDGLTLAAALAPFVARGWDVNSSNGKGQTLTHLVRQLDSAKVLAHLGADFSLVCTEGLSGGSRLRPEHFAELEREILSLAGSSPKPPAKSRSL